VIKIKDDTFAFLKQRIINALCVLMLMSRKAKLQYLYF